MPEALAVIGGDHHDGVGHALVLEERLECGIHLAELALIEAGDVGDVRRARRLLSVSVGTKVFV